MEDVNSDQNNEVEGHHNGTQEKLVLIPPETISSSSRRLRLIKLDERGRHWMKNYIRDEGAPGRNPVMVLSRILGTSGVLDFLDEGYTYSILDTDVSQDEDAVYGFFYGGKAPKGGVLPDLCSWLHTWLVGNSPSIVLMDEPYWTVKEYDPSHATGKALIGLGDHLRCCGTSLVYQVTSEDSLETTEQILVYGHNTPCVGVLMEDPGKLVSEVHGRPPIPLDMATLQSSLDHLVGMFIETYDGESVMLWTRNRLTEYGSPW